MSVIGHGRDTRILWDGSPAEPSWLDAGVTNSRYVGLTLDGAGKASVGLYHRNGPGGFETEVGHRHMALKLVHAGVRPLELFVWSSCFYGTKAEVRKPAQAAVYRIGNSAVTTKLDPGEVDEAAPPEGVANLSTALDDLRRLGEWDLKINHPDVSRR